MGIYEQSGWYPQQVVDAWLREAGDVTMRPSDARSLVEFVVKWMSQLDEPEPSVTEEAAPNKLLKLWPFGKSDDAS